MSPPALRRVLSTVARGAATYTQGQRPEPRVREYFYYVDHQGQLFLDDTKVKNFVTCFKDQEFLVFFFSRLAANASGRYQHDFPFLSLCGRERNFLRCDDLPVVFTHLLAGAGPERLSYCGGGPKLNVPFRPESLFIQPINGRLYHPGPQSGGGIGLVRSSLAYQLSGHFLYDNGIPTHFTWAGQRHRLTNELARHFLQSEVTAVDVEETK
ncbi:UPF0598 protein C8orf82 homolog [Denticeps clupeoides]|uniref:CH082 protein n=1 Tax=Denticeps clupeoides TaxID=299321 RepID=A0AAY4CU11_9TELE|nr:UPF0598 protein C8orf82 homolog [Denticeps clupeoides]